MGLYLGEQDLLAYDADGRNGALYRGDTLVFGGEGLKAFLGSEDGVDIFVSEDLQHRMIEE